MGIPQARGCQRQLTCEFGQRAEKRIRELEAERDQWQESSGQNYVRAQDAEMALERMTEERDRLRDTLDSVHRMAEAARAALNTEKGND